MGHGSHAGGLGWWGKAHTQTLSIGKAGPPCEPVGSPEVKGRVRGSGELPLSMAVSWPEPYKAVGFCLAPASCTPSFLGGGVDTWPASLRPGLAGRAVPGRTGRLRLGDARPRRGGGQGGTAVLGAILRRRRCLGGPLCMPCTHGEGARAFLSAAWLTAPPGPRALARAQESTVISGRLQLPRQGCSCAPPAPLELATSGVSDRAPGCGGLLGPRERPPPRHQPQLPQP